MNHNDLPPELREKTNRYPLLSAILLLSIPASCLFSFLVVRDQSYAWLTAIALLITPLSIFCWIFTTIRAIHLVGVRFWFIPSMGLWSNEAARRGHQTTDITLYVTAPILYGGCVVWSYFYNWHRTGSAILAVSLTILQTLSAAFLIGLINLWLNRNSMKQYERGHGIG